MASQITNYQCPACTGPLHFDGESGKLKCDYCDSTYDVKEIEDLYADKEAEAAAAQAAAEARDDAAKAWDAACAGGEWGEDAAGMRAYSCPSCGAQIICDETTAATSCPYCGNPTVVPGQFGGTKRPDYVIPFKLGKEDAIAALKRHYKGKTLLPDAFTDQNHIDKIQGVYVPFWLFNGEADGDMTFHATTSHTYTEGDYRVTDTQHYHVQRSGSLTFEKVPVDGSAKMPDEIMDSIEPFDYSELTEFSTAYLPGFLADKYDVDAEAASGRADERCRGTIIESLRDTVTGYGSVNVRSQNISLSRGEVKYALLPVWMLNTSWNGKNYIFAMNGQTGKLVGDLPMDKNKFLAWLFGIGLSLTAVLSFFFSGAFSRLLS